MTNLYVVELEKIETRYTTRWSTHIPKLIEKYAQDNDIDLDIFVIEGDQRDDPLPPGAFLNFNSTNIYKSSQLISIAELFQQGKVQPNDIFLYTDAWNPTVIQLKYISELMGIPVKIHGLQHAGSWDPQDFLGRLIGDRPWVRNAERSMYDCYDVNWFASSFHANLYADTFGLPPWDPKIQLTGWPMEYLVDVLKPYAQLTKRNQIVFPHRIAPEKQLEIFRDLAASMPHIDWVVSQDTRLTKDQYHTQLGHSQIVFSANLQETLGISTCLEAPLVNAIPLAPDRLSYQEIIIDDFRYPSEWTESWDSYQAHKVLLTQKINHLMEQSVNNPYKVQQLLQTQREKSYAFMCADNLLHGMLNHLKK